MISTRGISTLQQISQRYFRTHTAWTNVMATEPGSIQNTQGKSIGDNIELVGNPIGHTGYGLMGLTWRGNPEALPSQGTVFHAMQAALENNANFWDGGEIYGTPERNSLHLLREYFERYPSDADKVVLSIKGGADKGSLRTNGSAENTRRSIEECLAILGGKKKLDIWQNARIDKEVPVEVMMHEADKYVKAGKIGGVGLSECSAESIRRAAKITKIAAVEVEFSLWERTILENGVTQACAELDIPIIAYSPLGRGFLTGQIKSPDDISEGDFRKAIPRFQGENFKKNLQLVSQIEDIARGKGCTSGQVGLAWIRAQSGKKGMPVCIPIPGASSEKRILENTTVVELSNADLEAIDDLLSSFEPSGERYPAEAAAKLFGDSPELKTHITFGTE